MKSKETIAITAGRPEHQKGASLNPPIQLTSTYLAGAPVGYGRFGNETWAAVEDAISQLENAKTAEDLLKKELNSAVNKYETEIARLKNDFEQQQERNGTFQQQLAELNRQKSVWKEKITEDLKKIKLKEKELENRYELLKKDHGAQMGVIPFSTKCLNVGSHLC